MSDHYATLGVGKQATPEEIKRAYRKLASQHHPDKGGDTATFQRVEEAYRILSDPQQRQQYDNPNPFGAQGGFPGGFHFDFGSGGNPFQDIFQQFHQQNQQARQRLYTVAMAVTLEDVANGIVKTVNLQTPDGIKLAEIRVPRGIENGAQIRYNGVIDNGMLQVEFRVLPHQHFERDGLNVVYKQQISVFDLVLGTTVTVPTIYGKQLEVNIPPKTSPSRTLRLGGYGIEADGRIGDQYILLLPFIPATIDPEVIEVLTRHRQT
jgi:DnaJ-class molecular chaperone